MKRQHVNKIKLKTWTSLSYLWNLSELSWAPHVIEKLSSSEASQVGFTASRWRTPNESRDK